MEPASPVRRNRNGSSVDEVFRNHRATSRLWVLLQKDPNGVFRAVGGVTIPVRIAVYPNDPNLISDVVVGTLRSLGPVHPRRRTVPVSLVPEVSHIGKHPCRGRRNDATKIRHRVDIAVIDVVRRDGSVESECGP